MDIVDHAKALEERWDVFLYGQVEMNRGSIPEIRIPAFQPSIQIQHSGFAVLHIDVQQRVLKIIERLGDELKLPI